MTSMGVFIAHRASKRSGTRCSRQAKSTGRAEIRDPSSGWRSPREVPFFHGAAPLRCPARRALVFLLLPYLLYMVMLASFWGDRGATVLARHALVGAFHLH